MACFKVHSQHSPERHHSKPSVRIVSSMTKIRSECLQNAGLKCFHYTLSVL
jgi:hypothetical protein